MPSNQNAINPIEVGYILQANQPATTAVTNSEANNNPAVVAWSSTVTPNSSAIRMMPTPQVGQSIQLSAVQPGMTINRLPSNVAKVVVASKGSNIMPAATPVVRPINGPVTINAKGSLTNVQTVNSSPVKIFSGSVTPTKLRTVTISPASSPQKFTFVSGSGNRPAGQTLTLVNSVSAGGIAPLGGTNKLVVRPTTTVQHSPSKVFVKSVTSESDNAGVSQTNKFQYVRVIQASQAETGTSKPVVSAGHVKTLKAAPKVTPQPAVKIAIPPSIPTTYVKPTTQQRVLLPATAKQQQVTIQQANVVMNPSQLNITQLFPNAVAPGQQQPVFFYAKPVDSGTAAFTANANLGLQGNQLPPSARQPELNKNSGPSDNRSRKPCNCTKSQCLKLYCDCFANGEFCKNCNCNNCANNLEHDADRTRAIKACLERNPYAFHPKIGKGRGAGERRHQKGCNCKRSGCLKNYCECYEAKIPCSSMCKCVGCKNTDETEDSKTTLMHLADAAEVREQQQTAAKLRVNAHMSDVLMRRPPHLSGERSPYTFLTEEVADAMCSCMIAQAEEAERTQQLDMTTEKLILEEFGRCLMQVIQCAGRARAPSPMDIDSSSQC